MKINEVIMDKPFSAVFKESEVKDVSLKAGELLVRNEATVVSAGTELAIYKGTEGWAPLPFVPGYAAVGRIMELSKESPRKGFAVGDRVFYYGQHRSINLVKESDLLVKVPAGLEPGHAAFARIAAVSITAVRVSPPELGDVVMVFGMGLVGNLAAQLFALSGATVLCADICSDRLSLAQRCGLTYVVNSGKEDSKVKLQEISAGQGAKTVVEATGVPAIAEKAFDYVAKNGDLVLLGSPRGECKGDITALLNKVHLWGNGCVTLKGAHEWRFPLMPSEGAKHSLQRNCEILLNLLSIGALKVVPLITHQVSPSECQTVYQGLLNQKDKYNGVVFDWTK